METSSKYHMIPYDKKEEEDVQVKSDYLIIEDIEALLAGTDTVVCGMSSSQMTFESQTRMRSAAILASCAPAPTSHNWESGGVERTCLVA